MDQAEANAVLHHAAAKLGEHFEHICILATSSEGGQSSFYATGTGNYYARLGMCHQFIETGRAQDTAVQLSGQLNPPPSDPSAP